jgi:hypothetical protein
MSSDVALIKVLRACGEVREQVDPALFHSRHSCPISILSRRGYFDEIEVVKAVAAYLKIPYLDLFDSAVKNRLQVPELLEKLDPQLLRTHHIVHSTEMARQWWLHSQIHLTLKP